MNEAELRGQLAAELVAFNGLTTTSSTQLVTDAYNRILGIVQALRLAKDNPDNDPDLHVRAWNLLNNDAYKCLSEVQGGNTNALDDLKEKIGLVGETLLIG